MTQKIPVSSSLKENIDYLNQLFQKDITVKIRQFSNVENSDIRMCVFFVDGLTSEEFISEDIIAPIMHTKQLQEGTDLFVTVRDRVLIGCNISCSDDMSELLTSFLRGRRHSSHRRPSSGHYHLRKNWTIRSVSEPDSERVIQGPHEGFNESIMTNLSDPPEDHQPAAEIRIFHHRQKITDADRHVLYGRAGGQDDFVGDAPPVSTT